MYLVLTLLTKSGSLPMIRKANPNNGVWHVSLPSSPRTCLSALTPFASPWTGTRPKMSWVWPGVLDAEVEWTQPKKRVMILWKSRQGAKHLHNYPTSSTQDKPCCLSQNELSPLTLLFLSVPYLNVDNIHLHPFLFQSFICVHNWVSSTMLVWRIQKWMGCWSQLSEILQPRESDRWREGVHCREQWGRNEAERTLRTWRKGSNPAWVGGWVGDLEQVVHELICVLP